MAEFVRRKKSGSHKMSIVQASWKSLQKNSFKIHLENSDVMNLLGQFWVQIGFFRFLRIEVLLYRNNSIYYVRNSSFQILEKGLIVPALILRSNKNAKTKFLFTPRHIAKAFFANLLSYQLNVWIFVLKLCYTTTLAKKLH